jgi:hypothetical protein
MSEITRLNQLRQEGSLSAARDLALVMLHKSRKREVIDAALNTLENVPLDEDARPVLREKVLHYFNNPANDKVILIREKIIRMLTGIGSHEDIDIYLRGVNTYETQPFMGEVAQNLRAVSLVGLALANGEQGSIYATKLLSEIDSTSQFNGEPSITAINLLHEQGKTLPIYQFLLLGGLDALETGRNEVVGKALESLGADFPATLYQQLADLFVPRDRALVNMGIVSHIVEHKVESLYPILDQIITSTRHHELHNYGVVLMAVSRDAALIARLYALAKLSPKQRADNFIEALELIPGEEKDAILALLRRK